ncbi:MAG: FAD-dependent oxidoreductase, partial [Planctomycetaceae bacterium]|nr:FAD-dependent oxidoreductase [Planctomycetaceae bacterium]
PNLGNLVAQMNHRRDGNAMPADYYEDERKMNLLAAETGVKAFFCTRAIGVEMDGKNLIEAVIGKHIETGKETRFAAPLFADCTGDGNVGYYAGADWRMGRESKAETGESLAPEVADKMTMGASVQWYSVETGWTTTFPNLPWAVQFNDATAKPMVKGDWDWETGLNFDQIWDFERIRDHGLRAAYGHWAYMKNQAGGEWPERVRNRQLGWVAFIAGKRESRRLLGDVILQEQDIRGQREWPDAAVTTTWTIDLHYPTEKNSRDFPGEEFMTVAHFTQIEPYAIPYRCLYSRNINNLFMAGRDISVTHVALGTIRVQRTGGMMGEVVGMAASLCKKHNTLPRGVYENHLDDLKALMEEGVAPPPVPKSSVAVSKPAWLKDAGENFARKANVTVSSLYTKANYPASSINDGNYDLANNAGRWVSDEDSEHWVTFEWEQPVKINAVRILSGQAGDGTPKTPVTDFSLQLVRGRWIDIPGTVVTENEQCDFGCKFPEVETNQLRLRITTTPGNLARLWEVEFYLLP